MPLIRISVTDFARRTSPSSRPVPRWVSVWLPTAPIRWSMESYAAFNSVRSSSSPMGGSTRWRLSAARERSGTDLPLVEQDERPGLRGAAASYRDLDTAHDRERQGSEIPVDPRHGARGDVGREVDGR